MEQRAGENRALNQQFPFDLVYSLTQSQVDLLTNVDPDVPVSFTYRSYIRSIIWNDVTQRRRLEWTPESDMTCRDVLSHWQAGRSGLQSAHVLISLALNPPRPTAFAPTTPTTTASYAPSDPGTATWSRDAIPYLHPSPGYHPHPPSPRSPTSRSHARPRTRTTTLHQTPSPLVPLSTVPSKLPHRQDTLLTTPSPATGLHLRPPNRPRPTSSRLRTSPSLGNGSGTQRISGRSLDYLLPQSLYLPWERG